MAHESSLAAVLVAQVTAARRAPLSRVPLGLLNPVVYRVYAQEEDILELFRQHGRVAGINVFKCRRSGRSKGCGFVEVRPPDTP